MSRYITLTDQDDHGQGNSPLILDAELVVAMTEYDRGQTLTGTHIARGKAGTRIVVAVPYGNIARSFYVQETIDAVAGLVDPFQDQP